MDQSHHSRSISLRYKVTAYVAAWVLALFATDPSGALWALAWMFPLGLAGFVSLKMGNDGGWGVFALCVVIYLVQTYFYFRSKTVRSTIVWFAVLAILLLSNISGCRSMSHVH